MSAADDVLLFTHVKSHLATEHPDRDVVDERLRGRIAANARDSEEGPTTSDTDGR